MGKDADKINDARWRAIQARMDNINRRAAAWAKQTIKEAPYIAGWRAWGGPK